MLEFHYPILYFIVFIPFLYTSPFTETFNIYREIHIHGGGGIPDILQILHITGFIQLSIRHEDESNIFKTFFVIVCQDIYEGR